MKYAYRYLEAVTNVFDEGIESNPADHLIFFLTAICLVGVAISILRSMVRKYYE